MSYHNDPRNTPELLAALASHGLQAVSPSQLSDAFRIAWWAQDATIAHLTAELAEARQKVAIQGALLEGGIRRVEKVEAERDALIGAAYEAGRDDAIREIDCQGCYGNCADPANCRQDDVKAIRALTPPADLVGRTKEGGK